MFCFCTSFSCNTIAGITATIKKSQLVSYLNFVFFIETDILSVEGVSFNFSLVVEPEKDFSCPEDLLNKKLALSNNICPKQQTFSGLLMLIIKKNDAICSAPTQP